MAGCARAETAQDKQIGEMREQITRMQQERDDFDKRLGQVEVAMAEEKAPADTAKAEPSQVAPPRVVQLGGDDDGANDD
ncbi:MAG TPA: hypothetical protein VIF62_23960, partial [Labilithrix sp.]